LAQSQLNGKAYLCVKEPVHGNDKVPAPGRSVQRRNAAETIAENSLADEYAQTGTTQWLGSEHSWKKRHAKLSCSSTNFFCKVKRWLSQFQELCERLNYEYDQVSFTSSTHCQWQRNSKAGCAHLPAGGRDHGVGRGLGHCPH
jgi:hypothetical protein